jgi:hypothetical protein
LKANKVNLFVSPVCFLVQFTEPFRRTTYNTTKSNWVSHILLWKQPLEHVIEGKREMKERRERSRKQLLDDKEKRNAI